MEAFPPGHPMRRFEPHFEFYTTESASGKDFWRDVETGRIVDTTEAEAIVGFLNDHSKNAPTTSIGELAENTYETVRSVLDIPGSRCWDDLTDHEREWLCHFYSEAMRTIPK